MIGLDVAIKTTKNFRRTPEIKEIKPSDTVIDSPDQVQTPMSIIVHFEQSL